MEKGLEKKSYKKDTECSIIMRTGFLFLCFFCLVTPVLGTSAIVMRTPDEIIIAVDSKGSDIKNNTTTSHCKIIRKGNSAIVYSGPAIRKEFNIPDILKGVILTKGSILSKADLFEKIIAEPFSAYIKGTDPDSSMNLHIAFASNEEGLLEVLVRSYDGSSGSLKMSFNYLCPRDCKSGRKVFYLGEHRAINEFMKDNPNYWSENNHIDGMRILLEKEIIAHPELVGPPIDILKIATFRSDWIQKKEICNDID